MEFEKFELYVLCRDINSRLSSLAELVAEGQELDSTLDFTRFLTNSGIVKLLKRNPQPQPLPVDGYLVEGLIKDLEYEIRRRYRTGDVKPNVPLSELKRISHKLDLIAGQLSYLPVPKVENAATPLRIIEGGKNV